MFARMFVILLSPILAFSADIIIQRFSISKKWIILTVLIVTLPSLVIWLSGYSYSNTIGNYIGIMFFIAGIVLAVFSFDNRELRSKILSTILLFIIIGIAIFLASFFSLFSHQADKILSKTSSHSYKAIYSRDFDLVLAGPERLTIKKTKIFGLIEKIIYSDLLANPDTNPTCVLTIRHENKNLSFDYCKNTLTIIE